MSYVLGTEALKSYLLHIGIRYGSISFKISTIIESPLNCFNFCWYAIYSPYVASILSIAESLIVSLNLAKKFSYNIFNISLNNEKHRQLCIPSYGITTSTPQCASVYFCDVFIANSIVYIQFRQKLATDSLRKVWAYFTSSPNAKKCYMLQSPHNISVKVGYQVYPP